MKSRKTRFEKKKLPDEKKLPSNTDSVLIQYSFPEGYGFIKYSDFQYLNIFRISQFMRGSSTS